MTTSRRSLFGIAAAGVAGAAASKLGQSSGPQFIVAAVTTLDRAGRFDDGMNKDYLAMVAEGGADGALALGTTGEFSSFSVKERKQILESFLRYKGKLGITCQVTTPNLPETLDLLAHAAAAGADSALVLPPFYYKNPSVDGVAAFYEPILKAARLPVLLYNIVSVRESPGRASAEACPAWFGVLGSSLGGRPVVRQKLGNPGNGMIGDAGENVFEPGERINSDALTGSHETP
jgi:hypothetical protein